MIDISVLIATYNQKERLSLVLEGLRCQSFPQDRFEVIVVDDGCTDGTCQTLKKAEASLVNLQVVTLDPNQGRCSARNHGIQQAKGQLVVFLDGDALPHPDLLRHYWKAYQETQGEEYFFGFYYSLPDLEYFQDPATGVLVDRPLASFMKDYIALHRQEMVVTPAYIACDFGTIHQRADEGIYPTSFVAAMQRQTLALFEHISTPRTGWLGFIPHNAAVPLEALLRVEGFDPSIPFCEGWEMAFRLEQAGYHAMPVKEAQSYHLYHFHSFSDPEKAREETRIRRRAIEYMASKHQVPWIQLIFFWFAALSSTPFFSEETVVRHLVEFERLYSNMTPEKWIGYQAILDRNPLWVDQREG